MALLPARSLRGKLAAVGVCLFGLLGLSTGLGCGVLSATDNRCQSSGDCPLDQHCDLASGACVPGQIKNPFDVDECTIPTEKADCGPTGFCIDRFCHVTSECSTDDDCGIGTDLHCWPDRTCNREERACLVDEDCDEGHFCSIFYCSEDGACTALPGPCSESDDGAYCDEDNDACRSCITNEHCDDGLFCTGGEFCVDFFCTDDGFPCADPNPACDEIDDRCVECDDAADCQDDEACNGIERCVLGSCTAGSSPCAGAKPVCLEGAAASLDGGTPEPDVDGGPVGGADAGVDISVPFTCIACLNAAHCEDQLFCTGTESCVAGNCQATGDPCAAPDAGSCLEALDDCGDCQTNADCSDGSWCSGEELCLPDGSCNNDVPDRCVGNTAQPHCDEAAQTCRECLEDAHCEQDGDLCTVPRCENFTCFEDPFTCAEPDRVPEQCREFCPGNLQQGQCNVELSATCFECTNDSPVFDCSTKQDGQWCNGPEVCTVLEDGTQGGSCLPDGDPCVYLFSPEPFCYEPGDCCRECAADFHCDDGQFCNGAEDCVNANSCNANCVSPGNPCFGLTPICIENGNRCVECTNNGHCTVGTQLLCNPADNNCYECYQNNQCPDDGQFCTGNRICLNTNPRDCSFTGNPCNGATPICVEATNSCVQCTQNSHCGGGTPFCNTGTNQCVECLGDANCPGEVCNLSSGTCVECNNNGDCPDDGQFCTGNPICQGNNTCSFAGNNCNGATPFCDEGGNQCVQCENNGHCSNNQFCDGVETCNAGTCQAGPGDPCMAPTPFCDEGADQCVQCVNNGDCSNNLFCDGVEQCNGGACQDGADPCNGATPYCNDTTDTCFECMNNGECDDNDFCTGAETCDGTGTCQAGAGNPCLAPTPVCRSVQADCVQCTDAAQHCQAAEDCVNNVCVPQ